MKSQQMFICLSTIAVQGILRSQIVVEMTLWMMRSKGPRKSQKMLKKRGGSDVQKAMCCQEKNTKLLNPVEMEEELKACHQPVRKWTQEQSRRRWAPSLRRTFQTKQNPCLIPQRISWGEKVKWNPSQCIWAWDSDSKGGLDIDLGKDHST